MNHHRGPRTRCLLLALVASLSACRIDVAPDPSAGLGPTARVLAPVLNEEIGALHLAADGLWAFRPKEKSRLATYEVGQVVAYGDVEEQSRHLFAVTEKHSWGLSLQRLDVDPVEQKGEGAFVPLSTPDANSGDRWGYCVGSGDPATSDCLEKARPGTRWYIYPLNEADRVVVTRERRPNATAPPRHLPVPLVGIVAVGALGTDAHLGEVPARWLAVPGPVLPRPTVPRIAVHSSCRDTVADPRALDAAWLFVDTKPADHPVQVSAAAFEHGTDAFVACESGRARLWIPGLYRRRVDVPGRGFSAPPFLAAGPQDLGTARAEIVRLAARLGSAISTGDFATADYYAERLSRTSNAREVDELLLRSMPAVADGGRPEAAVALGLHATRQEWNAENSAPWVWGMSIAEDTLGAANRAIVRTQTLSEVLDRSGDDLMRGWFVYFWAVEELKKRESAGEVLNTLEAHPLYLLAVRADAARRGGAEGFASLEPEFDRHGARPLLRALAGEDVALPCEGALCVPDVYGRIWAAGHADPLALSRVGKIDLRPGYRVPEQIDDPMAALRTVLAAYPLFQDDDRNAAVDEATQAATQWVGTRCLSGEDATAEISALVRLGIDAALRMEDWQTHPFDATMAWLAIRGIPAACESPDSLSERAAELAENVGSATVPAELLSLWVEHSSGDALRRVLDLGAKYAAKYERGQRCMDWNLALAVANVRASRFDDAAERVDATAACRASDRFEVDLVSAYLNFQRTSTISPDFERRVRERLALVVHEKPDATPCFGAGQLDYHLLPSMSETVAELVRRLPPTPTPPDDELRVVTASDRLSNARESLVEVAQHLDAGRAVDAAKALGHAAESFDALGHAVGRSRVRWVDQTLFGGRATEVAAGQLEPKNALPPTLRKKTLSQALADAKPSPDLELAHAILTGDETKIRALTDAPSARSTFRRFCEAPDERPSGTVIDRGTQGLEKIEIETDESATDPEAGTP